MKKNKAALLILDGWGLGQNPKVDAIQKAATPFIDSLYKNYPNSQLITYGEEVGLPKGQMGNSEVGHLNIGAGRVVYQTLARINKAIEEDTLSKNKALNEAFDIAWNENKPLHLFGLLSDGGVHSHIEHLKALCDLAVSKGLKAIYIHAFLDGRDTDPKGGLDYINQLLNHIEDTPVKLASVIGRYYAMDRDQRWERVKLAYDLMVHAKGEYTHNILATIRKHYDNKKTDEFMPAIVCLDNYGNPIQSLDNDAVAICFNFRTDRPREISQVLSQSDMPEYDMKALRLHYVTMTAYDSNFKNVHVAFEKEDLQETMGEVVSKAGRTQMRIAETEKYPHVSFFFSGGREEVFPNESRIMIPSPKVATYDLKPEMSAFEITEAIIKDIKEDAKDFICLNFANTDMVGHTGDFEAAKQAAIAVDQCVQTLSKVLLEYDYATIIIADHGNADFMINEDGTPHTAHTTNPVPCFLVSNNAQHFSLTNGKLADIAPSLLDLMEIEQPKLMTGTSLITKK